MPNFLLSFESNSHAPSHSVTVCIYIHVYICCLKRFYTMLHLNNSLESTCSKFILIWLKNVYCMLAIMQINLSNLKKQCGYAHDSTSMGMKCFLYWVLYLQKLCYMYIDWSLDLRIYLSWSRSFYGVTVQVYYFYPFPIHPVLQSAGFQVCFYMPVYT